MESLLASDLTLIREAWIRMLVWYKESLDRHPPPARVDLVTMTSEREEISGHVPSPVEPIPVEDPPFLFLVDDFTLEDEEITRAKHMLLLNCSGGPSGFRAKHICQWLVAAMQDA